MKRIILLFLLSNIIFSEDLSVIQVLKELYKLIPNIQVRTLYFNQRLDHFNPENTQIWRQRYWVSATYYRRNGPAFLFINGEEIVDSIELGFPSAWRAYAKEVNAICFSIDHRFYGESWPTNASITYLNTKQALADIENFIKGITKEFKFKGINWIVFGCSYAGTLATWARLKYPKLIRGAVASSAPLLAIADFYQYPEMVEQAIITYNPKCLESISSAVEELADSIKTNKKIKIDMNISSNTSIFEIINLLLRARPEYMEPKRVLYEMIRTLNCVARVNEIPTVCDTIINFEGSKVQAFFELDKISLLCHQEGAAMARRNYDNNPKARITDGWNYQRCSELGFFPSYSKTTYLSAVIHLLSQFEADVKTVCDPFLGSNFSLNVLQENVNRTNSIYGGLDINIDNVVFVHGSLDPWHSIGLHTKMNSSLYETIFIKGVAHCADIQLNSERDIPDLENARKKILELLKVWLEKKST